MAKRRTYGRPRYYRAKRFHSRRKGLFSGNMGNILIGAIAGAGSNFIPQFFGKYTNPVVFGAGGYLLKKPALLTVAGYELGKGLIGGFGGGNANGGLFEG